MTMLKKTNEDGSTSYVEVTRSMYGSGDDFNEGLDFYYEQGYEEVNS